MPRRDRDPADIARPGAEHADLPIDPLTVDPLTVEDGDPHLSLRARPTAGADLARLAGQARRDLAALAHPAGEWVRPVFDPSGQHVFDVAIIGAGQSGLVIGLALKREGVGNVVLLDRNPAGYEGPWETFARMAVLRTPKEVVGAELGIPSLSLRTWFEARYGAEVWDRISWIPRQDWMRYLRWYRGVADLEIRNQTSVVGIAPTGDVLTLHAVGPAARGTVLARRIVLATGQDGGGAWKVPDLIERALPRGAYVHSNGPIDFERFAGKRIGILGHGGSAFDAALTALSAGAARVDICFRRPRLPVVNPHRWLGFSAIFAHYPALDDRIRWNIARHFDLHDQPPPRHTFDRACRQPGLQVHADSTWEEVHWTGDAVEIVTRHRRFSFGFVICATGVSFDLALRPELDGIAQYIALWSDRFVPEPDEAHAALGKLPYLGKSYEFLEKVPGAAPWLSCIHAFNFSAMPSMGPVSTGISGHRYAVPRLVRGITRSLFLEQADTLLPGLRGFAEPELEPYAATMFSPAAAGFEG
jgi:cation diffusion facilitator CzcD-associated flavoprotein CzcO